MRSDVDWNPLAVDKSDFMQIYGRGHTTRKTVAAVLQNTAVRRRTAKIALPWDERITHGKELGHDNGATEHAATNDARQSRTRAHGKEWKHGNGRSQRTAKTSATAKAGVKPNTFNYARMSHFT
jgi:hypothetical protein